MSKPLYQAFTLADLPATNLPASQYNRTPMPTHPGYTCCTYEDRAWRADPSNPLDFSGFADWVKGLPERTTALVDLEPLCNALDSRESGRFSAVGLLLAADTIAAARSSRPDVKLYGYGLPFGAWTPTTRGRTPALAVAARTTRVANAAAFEAWIPEHKTTLSGLLSGVLVSLYVPWSSDADTPGLYWQRYIRRVYEDAERLCVPALGCLCPTYTHTPAGLGTEAALLPLGRWREAVAAVADIYDGAVIWYAPTAPYSIFRRHIEAAADVWRTSTSRNDK